MIVSDSGTAVDVPCPACSSTSLQTLFEARDLLHCKPGTFGVVRCHKCGFLFTNPRPPADQLGSYYPSEYAPYQRRPSEFDTRVSWVRRFLSNVFHLYMKPYDVVDIMEKPGERLLELGCSTGVFLALQRSKGYEVYGVEFADTPARFARESLGLKVFIGELEDAGYEEEYFDGIIAWMYLEHIAQPRRTLREINRVLKPGRRFAFSVPNAGSWEFRFFHRYWFALQVPTHQSHFTAGTLRQLLHAEGFDLERVYYQRNIDNIVSSLGYLLESQKLFPKISRWLKTFPDASSASVRFIVRPVLQPLAWLLAVMKQGGRMTVVARKR